MNSTTLVQEKDYFQALLDNKIAEYVEIELLPYFGHMIKLINQVDFEKEAMSVDAGISTFMLMCRCF
jgi:hypothetical protein